MNITHELRKWGLAALADKQAIEELTEIAGHIDENVAEYFMELPLDKDGEPIHVGDVMESDVDHLFDEASFRVCAIWLDEGGWEVYDRLGDRYVPSVLRHYHEPTVEDVLREFFSRYVTTKPKEEDDAIVSEYAAKLREVVEHDDATLGRETCSVCEGYDDEGEECGDVCSACGSPWVVYDANFCPYCGARKVDE